MLPWESDMPETVARGYALWSSVCKGNVSETARMLEVARSTVQDWVERYHWRERQATERAEDRDQAIARAWATMAAELDDSAQVVLRARSAVYGADGKPQPGDPTPTAVKAAVSHLGMFGITLQRTVTLDVAPAVSAHVSNEELDALLAAGDHAALLALAAGKPLPVKASARAAGEGTASVKEPNGAHPGRD